MESKSNSPNSQTKIADSKSAAHLCATEKTAVNFRSAELVQAAGGESRKTQRARILRLLLDAHGGWVPLQAILGLNVAQYNTRILELRRAGFAIENKTERVNSARHSWFRLVPSPVQQTLDPSTIQKEKAKSWDEIVAEREAKLKAPAPPFELVP